MAAAALRAGGIPGPVEATLLKRGNHVFRLAAAGAVYYLKCYTKDWYGGDVAGTGYHVDQEAAAYRLLAAHGIAAPEVLAAEITLDNPLQRPYLLTCGLPGRPLTTILAQASPAERAAALRCVGEYLAAMHGLVLPYPGYITSTGPAAPPDPEGWQHPIWTLAAFLKQTDTVWSEDRGTVPAPLVRRLEALLAEHTEALAAEFQPPRFTHGDCHAHQFFLEAWPEGGWRVTGVVDMEVASAGDRGADLVKFFLETAGRLSSGTQWWEDFFSGYQPKPDFALIKLRLLAAHHINYTCLGPDAWPGSRAQIVQHILDAENWNTLFDTRRMQKPG